MACQIVKYLGGHPFDRRPLPITKRIFTYPTFPYIFLNNVYPFFIWPILFPISLVFLFRPLFLPDYTVVISSLVMFKPSQFVLSRFTGYVPKIFLIQSFLNRSNLVTPHIHLSIFVHAIYIFIVLWAITII